MSLLSFKLLKVKKIIEELKSRLVSEINQIQDSKILLTFSVTLIQDSLQAKINFQITKQINLEPRKRLDGSFFEVLENQKLTDKSKFLHQKIEKELDLKDLLESIEK